MPLQDSEILWRPALLTSDAAPAQNGGRMRFTTSPSGVKNNLLPDVTKAEREAGATQYRKAFIHANSADDTALINARVFLDAVTPADDFVTLYPGTATDTENLIAGRPYGIGTLAESVVNGATSIEVACESASYATLEPFRAGDLVRLGPAGGANGHEQFVAIDSVTYDGADALLGLAAPLQFDFTASETIASSVIEQASIAAGIGSFVATSVAGMFDSATTGNASAHARGGVADTWTLTFTSASAFTIAGLATGSLGTGSIYADTSPNNPATGTPYWTLKMAGWGGTFEAGDTLRFDTTPAALAIWYRRDVPAGAAAAANNAASVAIYGESA